MLNPYKIKNFPSCLIIISILPVVSLYAKNISWVAFPDILRSIIVFLIAGLLAFGILFFITRKFHYAALIVSYGLFLFNAIVPLQSILILKGMLDIARLRYLFPLFGFVFISGVEIGFKMIHDPIRVTKIFNLVAFSSLLLPLFQIFFFAINVTAATEPPSINMNLKLSKPIDLGSLPDVYMIVLDTHGRSDDIKKELGYNNAVNLEKLTGMGFYIAECSNANYPDGTWPSMFATLNMQFMDHDKIRNQNQMQTMYDAFHGINNNKVLRFFKKMGYKFVNFNSGYDFLNFTDADVYYDFNHIPGGSTKLNTFESLLINESSLGISMRGSTLYKIDKRLKYENIRKILELLPKIPQEISSPKFIYAHILVPHEPYVFSSTGEYLATDQQKFTPQKYVDQVIFIDDQIAEVARQIIENSDTPPIILIQGDHGFTTDLHESRTSGILNAYYLPGADYSKYLYPSITPINSFRLVFNLYFSANMELLPDEIYRDSIGIYKQREAPYDFIQVTPMERDCSLESALK